MSFSRSSSRLRELFVMVREDRRTHGGRFWSAGFQTLAVHRFGNWVAGSNVVTRRLIKPLYRVCYLFVTRVYGIELPRSTTVGRRVKIVHQSGIVVHPRAVIGDECIIRHNVTIGAATGESLRKGPRLGDRVELGAGAVIIGDVSIGDDVRIGPNCVVMTSIPAGATVVASPPRVVFAPKPRAAPAEPRTPPAEPRTAPAEPRTEAAPRAERIRAHG